jgi:hypothetical protein
MARPTWNDRGNRSPHSSHVLMVDIVTRRLVRVKGKDSWSSWFLSVPGCMMVTLPFEMATLRRVAALPRQEWMGRSEPVPLSGLPARALSTSPSRRPGGSPLSRRLGSPADATHFSHFSR